MKKKVHKLELSRETVRRLETAPTSLVVGGISQARPCPSDWETCGLSCISNCTTCC